MEHAETATKLYIEQPRAETERKGAGAGMAGTPEWIRQGAADLTIWHFFGAFVLMRLGFEFIKPYILEQPDWLN